MWFFISGYKLSAEYRWQDAANRAHASVVWCESGAPLTPVLVTESTATMKYPLLFSCGTLGLESAKVWLLVPSMEMILTWPCITSLAIVLPPFMRSSALPRKKWTCRDCSTSPIAVSKITKPCESMAHSCSWPKANRSLMIVLVSQANTQAVGRCHYYGWALGQGSHMVYHPGEMGLWIHAESW